MRNRQTYSNSVQNCAAGNNWIHKLVNENKSRGEFMKYRSYLIVGDVTKPLEEATPEEKEALYVKILLAFSELSDTDPEEILHVYGEKYRKIYNSLGISSIKNKNEKLIKKEEEKELCHKLELDRIERKEYYTKTDVKNILSIQQAQVNEIFERDDFPCFLVADRYWRITKDDFNKWIDKQIKKDEI
ncbi:MAG: hypothetical protein E7211_20665 [Clostridium lundense]|nr:hypothetical protein [Clostridium lundense]